MKCSIQGSKNHKTVMQKEENKIKGDNDNLNIENSKIGQK